MSSDRSEWDGILDDDEGVIWQGQPSSKLRLEFDSAFEPFFYLFFTGFSVFWMIMASNGPGPFWMFGLLFFGIGSYQLVGQHFWKALLRRSTFYTLTNKRAFIAKRSPFGSKTLDSYPLDSDRSLRFHDGMLQSIYFAEEEKMRDDRKITRDIGFEMLADGRDVYRKMRDVQNALGET